MAIFLYQLTFEGAAVDQLVLYHCAERDSALYLAPICIVDLPKTLNEASLPYSSDCRQSPNAQRAGSINSSARNNSNSFAVVQLETQN